MCDANVCADSSKATTTHGMPTDLSDGDDDTLQLVPLRSRPIPKVVQREKTPETAGCHYRPGWGELARNRVYNLLVAM